MNPVVNACLLQLSSPLFFLGMMYREVAVMDILRRGLQGRGGAAREILPCYRTELERLSKQG